MNRDAFNQVVESAAKRHWRTVVAVLSIAYMAMELLQSFPYTLALRQATLPIQDEVDNIGLYGRSWGMFAGTNTNTSTVTLSMTYEDGSHQTYNYIPLRPGYARTAWSEVMQDIQFDDNNDGAGLYKAGFLRYTCDHPPVGTALPQSMELIQYRVYFSASNPTYNASGSTVIGNIICRP